MKSYFYIKFNIMAKLEKWNRELRNLVYLNPGLITITNRLFLSVGVFLA